MHPDFTINTPIESVVFHDPLSEVTRRVRRNLLITSGIAVMVGSYNLKIKKLPYVEILPDQTSEMYITGIIGSVLFALLIYLITVFLLYCYQDHKRWRLSQDIINLKHIHGEIYKLREDTNVISQHIKKNDHDSGSSLIGSVLKAVEKAVKRMSISESHIIDLYNKYDSLKRVQTVRLWTVDYGVPLFLSLLGLFYVRYSLIPLLKNVFPILF